MSPTAPLTSATSRPRRRTRRALALTTLASALALPVTPAAAHHDSHHAHQSETTAPSTAAAPAHGETPMFVVGTPERPLVTRGPSGPLWFTGTGSSHRSGLDAGERYVESALARARGEFLGTKEPVAERAAVLTTSQATKKLSKRCQKLVKVTSSKAIKKLPKADKKARTKCLEQRRKLISDSRKKKPSSPSTPGVTAPAPAAEGPKPNTDPTATPAPGATPTPTPTPTPKPGATPAPPTPAPPYSFPACTPGASNTITVTATDEGSPLAVSSGCARGGEPVNFKFVNADPFDEPHNLAIGAANLATGRWDGAENNTTSIVDVPIDVGDSRSKSLTLAPGKYVLLCYIVEHRTTMQVVFQVF